MSTLVLDASFLVAALVDDGPDGGVSLPPARGGAETVIVARRPGSHYTVVHGEDRGL